MTARENGCFTGPDVEPGTILLSADGEVYAVSAGKLIPLGDRQRSGIVGLSALVRDPTQHFFQTPYYAAG